MALNPVAYTEKVVNSFLKYQLTAYPFADPHLYAEMRRHLSLEHTRQTPLLKGPYISLSRSFRQGARVKELVADGSLHPFAENLIPYERVYGHQEKAIKAIHAGKTTLISTGTGSGKTECFLYPIISSCLKLRDEKAPPGIVAVLVYPMNALAEDQLGRLRDLLAGTGITFGMYVGKTPDKKADIAGDRLKAGSSRADYLKRLERAQKERRGTAVHPPEERCSREEMRTPGEQPRILLTNVKQLELLLTRQADVELFDNAVLDYIVFDEAHTFRGAAGAETACLIRRLRSFCGRGPDQTVCVATSATLADPARGPEAAKDFAARFFGVQAEKVALVTEEYEPELWAAKRIVPRPLPGKLVEHLSAVLKAVDAGENAGLLVSQALKVMVDATIRGEHWEEELYDYLAANELVFQLAEALHRPRPLAELLKDIETRVGRPVPEEEVLAWLALGAAARRGGRPLLRPVVHAFIRGIDGMVVSFHPKTGAPQNWLSAEDVERSRKEGKLAWLPVMTCQTCGQHYFEHHVADFAYTGHEPEGGEAVGDRRIWRPLDPSLGGKRVVLVNHIIGQDEDEASTKTTSVFFCHSCGTLHPKSEERCDGCGVPGPLVPLHALLQKEEHPGKLTRCISCGAIGRPRGDRYREPARRVRAVTVSDVHVLAQDMVHHAERRRLLIFADNRQDAAFQAGWMRDHARRFRLRGIMAERIKQGPVSVGDLTAYLDEVLEPDDDLSQALVPEVWNVYRKEAEGLKHAEERKRFLRIQVLREITSGLKQRVGLEPWGRLRLAYPGLLPTAPFIVRWASGLGLKPEELVEGVAALLDRWRRTFHLKDSEGHIFSKYWQEGDFEIQRGYLPIMQGVPKGLKLRREGDDDGGRVTQWLSARGDTIVRQTARAWGVKKDDIESFCEELWEHLTSKTKILAPETLKGMHGKNLPRCPNTYQIDGDKLLLVANRGLWRCKKCRRAQIRRTPLDRCLAWHCDGTLAYEDESPDNYDLSLLDAGLQMIRPREHSAQVPNEERERLERLFKGEGEAVNTLVCTPTLELGIDIGALDAVLMRNVPPQAANYWQRAGRAGRRHRMAVNITYARPTSHDRAYFANPQKILEGEIEPPRFNLRNELMVAKHVHATVLTRLHQLARQGSGFDDAARKEIEDALGTVLPQQIRDYLFDERGHVRTQPFDVSPLTSVISRHVAGLVKYVQGIFEQGWPKEDKSVVSEANLERCVGAMTEHFSGVLNLLKKRLDWALVQLRRLDEIRRKAGTLAPDEDALHKRCDRLVKKYKGQVVRKRKEAAGYDDINTYNVLSAEGFLPGYGLEIGAVIGTAHVPRQLASLADFDLPRAPSLALREYVPGNLIYANGHRFIARAFHLEPEEQPTMFAVDVANEAVADVGISSEAGATAVLGAASLRAVSVCDVDLFHVSHISDDEDHRFQLPVATYGYELGRHSGGRAFTWGERSVQLRRGVHFRLVNVGANALLDEGRFGYPVCLVCGQSRSPFASKAERENFEKDHLDRCGQPVEPTGFFADVVVDAFTIADCENRDEAYSLAEGLRTGAASVLDMEQEDLQILVIGHPGSPQADAVLYDPMPGGSGLLDQLCGRFGEVGQAAIDVLENCGSRCARACIDCLYTFRNAHFHKHLDRTLAGTKIRKWTVTLQPGFEIPAKHPAVEKGPSEMPVNAAEATMLRLLRSAHFPEPELHYEILLGRPLGSTRPDYFYPGEDEHDKGICIYLDGLSGHIHGNPATQKKDRQIREELRERGYEVFEIAASQLTDRDAMVSKMARLGKMLLGADRARELKASTGWFDTPAPP